MKVLQERTVLPCVKPPIQQIRSLIAATLSMAALYSCFAAAAGEPVPSPTRRGVSLHYGIAAFGEAPTHEWIATQAYQTFRTSLPAEIGEFLNGRDWADAYTDFRNCALVDPNMAAETGGFIVEGTEEEDIYNGVPGDGYYIGTWKGNPLCDPLSLPGETANIFNNHFWNPDLDGWDKGYPNALAPNLGRPTQCALHKALYYWRMGVLSNYPADKALAYYYLGRIAHLLADMSVPAHVHNDGHGNVLVGEDAYEEYFHDMYLAEGRNFYDVRLSGYLNGVQALDHNALPQKYPWGRCDSWGLYDAKEKRLADLFYNLAQQAQYFDSTEATGNNAFGSAAYGLAADQGSRHANGFTAQEVDTIVRTMLPKAVQSVASLYQLFWDTTHSEGLPDGVLDADVQRAIQVAWLSKDDKQYRILRSYDLKTWDPLPEIFYGTGSPLFAPYSTEAWQGAFYKVEELPLDTSQRFAAISQVNLDAATSLFSGNHLSIDNMRVESKDATLNDYISATFVFDPDAQVFRLESKATAVGVGVYHAPYFAKDVPSQIYLRSKAGAKYAMGQRINLTLTQPSEFFFDELQVGHVVSWLLSDIASKDVKYEWVDPSGIVRDEFICSKGGGVISDANPVLKAGTYTLRLTPFPSGTGTLGLTFLNANRQQMQTKRNGDWISFQFQNNIQDYAKFRVQMAKNQMLSLEEGDSDISITMINERSEEIFWAIGLPVKYVAPADGWYYLFVDNRKGWGGTYSSTLRITQGPGLAGALGQQPPPRSSRGGASVARPW